MDMKYATVLLLQEVVSTGNEEEKKKPAFWKDKAPKWTEYLEVKVRLWI